MVLEGGRGEAEETKKGSIRLIGHTFWGGEKKGKKGCLVWVLPVSRNSIQLYASMGTEPGMGRSALITLTRDLTGSHFGLIGAWLPFPYG